MFDFEHPYMLLLLAPLAGFLVWHYRARRRASPRLPFSSLAVAGLLPRTGKQRLRPVVDLFRALALALTVASLAGPGITRAAESPTEGIDIVLALDVSYSMTTRDMGPKTRLETAKDVIREFVGGRQGDRIGLVVFEGEAVGLSPLTTDYAGLLKLLDDAQPGRLPGGTAIGNGLATGLAYLSDGRGRSRIAVLLTDGENNSGDVEPGAAAQIAQQLNVRVYTVGAGAEPIVPGRGGRQLPAQRRDEMGETLRPIAETTGGAYFRATDAEALKGVYGLIDRLEKSETDGTHRIQVLDISGQIVLIALVFFFAETALRHSWLREVP